MAWTDKYVSAAGGGAHDGSSEANAWTLAECIAAPYAVGQRINVKAGTYANTTTGRAFAVAGTTTQPVWFRGYKTTIGDLDDGITVARSLQDGVNLPLWTFTTGQLTVTGTHHIFSNIDITSQCTTTNGAIAVTGGNNVFVGVRSENTATNSAAKAFFCSTATAQLLYGCRFKGTTTVTYAASFGIMCNVLGCTIIGGVNAALVASSSLIDHCVFSGFTTSGMEITSATGTYLITNCTIYAAATNGILISTIPTTGMLSIQNCIIGGCTNGINNSSGGNTNTIRQFRNHFYSCTNNLVAITEMATVGADLGVLLRLVDDDTDPFVNKATGDFSLADAAIDRAAGFPGVFEGQTAMNGKPDIGAVSHAENAAGGRPEFRGSNL